MRLLKPEQRYMLQRIERNERAITREELTAPGGKAAQTLKSLEDKEYVQVVPHKSAIDPITNRPKDAYALTSLGREVLEIDGR